MLNEKSVIPNNDHVALNDVIVVYRNRIADEYKWRLITLIEKYIVWNNPDADNYCVKLKAELPITDPHSNEKYEKVIEGDTCTHAITIDFCGLSSSTILNTCNTDEAMTPKINNRDIHDKFKDLISDKNCEVLNRNGICLQIRFLYAYMYSEMPFSLMKAERERKGLDLEPNKKALYDFEEEPGLEKYYFTDSTIRKSQEESLGKLGLLTGSLKRTKLGLTTIPFNSVSIRFCPLPIPFCLAIIDYYAFMDPYMYAMQEKQAELSFNIPLIEVDLKKDESYKRNIFYHFNYLWYHDLTIRATDATTYLDNQQLKSIKYPYYISWNEKEKMIKEYLEKNKVPAEKYSSSIIDKWHINLTNRFNKSTKLPFDHRDARRKVLTVLFTDFKDFSSVADSNSEDNVVNELEACFKIFNEICLEYGLFKVKTIGDSFMCVAGLYSEEDAINIKSSAKNAVRAGVEMIKAFINRNENRSNRQVRFNALRIGINTGNMLLLHKQMEFDVFGSVVNLAQRMQSEAGKNGDDNMVYLYEHTRLEVEDAWPQNHFENKGKYRDKSGKEHETMWKLDPFKPI